MMDRLVNVNSHR